MGLAARHFLYPSPPHRFSSARIRFPYEHDLRYMSRAIRWRSFTEIDDTTWPDSMCTTLPCPKWPKSRLPRLPLDPDWFHLHFSPWSPSLLEYHLLCYLQLDHSQNHHYFHLQFHFLHRQFILDHHLPPVLALVSRDTSLARATTAPWPSLQHCEQRSLFPHWSSYTLHSHLRGSHKYIWSDRRCLLRLVAPRFAHGFHLNPVRKSIQLASVDNCILLQHPRIAMPIHLEIL